MDKLSERLALVGVVDPDANAAGTFYTDAVDMADFNEVLLIFLLGISVTAGSHVLSATEEAASGTGTGSVAISGKAATAKTTGNNDTQSIVHVRASDLQQGFRYVYGRLVQTSAGADSAVVAIAGAPRFHPATDYDLASVSQIVD